MQNKPDQFELPFRQLLWHVYHLRKAEQALELAANHHTEAQAKRWREKVDAVLANIGIDEDTDLKTVQFSFICKD